jgi:hypothetical protein
VSAGLNLLLLFLTWVLRQGLLRYIAKKGPTSDVATAFWNLLIFYDDMAFTSMCWISASWIIVSLVSAVLRAQCSVGLAN